jgi:hypothetical protein
VVQRTTILEDEPMIQALSPDRADEPFHERFCHGLCGAVSTLLDAHAHHAMSKWLTVDAVTVADEIGRRGLVREGVDELLRDPDGGGVLGHVEVDDAPAVVSEDDENERTRRRAVGRVKKSMETRSPTWLARNVRQVGEGRRRCFGMRRDTVRSAKGMPSFRSSPWMRGVSGASWRWPPKRKGGAGASEAQGWSRAAIVAGRARQINHLLDGRRLGEDNVDTLPML